MGRLAAALRAVLVLCLAAFVGLTPLFGCAGRSERIRPKDALAVLRLMRDSARAGAALSAEQALWSRDGAAPLTFDERAFLLPLFARVIDYDLALESFCEIHLRSGAGREDARELALGRALGLGAYARQLFERLRLLALVSDNAAITAALDEGSPAHGVAPGQLTRLSIETARPDTPLQLDIAFDALLEARAALPAEAATITDLQAAWQLLRLADKAARTGQPLPPDKQAKVDAIDGDAIAAAVADTALDATREARAAWRKSGGKLLHHVIGVMLGNEIGGVIDPLVKDIALWLGDTRLRDDGGHLISEAQLAAVQPRFEPGDVIVERRNWYLSNLGLPGFWPHAALYVGSAAELEAWAADPGVLSAFPGGLTARIAAESPEAWQAFLQPVDGHPARVLEAVSEGVIVNSIEHSCLADHVAFLRPRRSKAERAWAIAESFRHFGKPYDFDFDFLTVSQLVCSELVYTAYNLPTGVGVGLRLDPLPEVMGRVALPPNDLIARFDEEFGRDDRQFDFVVFLDGDEGLGAALERDAEALRASWLRPKWDLNQ